MRRRPRQPRRLRRDPLLCIIIYLYIFIYMRGAVLVSRDGGSVARFDGVLTVDLEPEISRLLAPPEDPWDPADAPPSAPGCGS
mmetsp:Transcript_12619/g.34872  ORF Transcript_12619/g.34872 Transcript_12619/m.34872 type:complete len:83 (-) Transcript_12619:117-365(-)